jgi:hypothetical protein
MATGAIGSKLRLVHINMARRTEADSAREFQCFVAAYAFRVLVLPLERKTGFRVSKGRVSPHLP